MKYLSNRLAAGGVLLVSLTLAAPASAELEEIVVTAQKREESLNDVPISITAIDQAKMNQANLTDVTSLINYAPGVTGSAVAVASTTWRIRGIGTIDWNVSSEPAVAVFMDDAYIGRNTIASLSFLDLERVEVLKGPQGTLAGRNASAGSINLITRKPEAGNSLELGLGFGNEGQQRYTLVGNVGTDTAGLRIAYRHNEFDGIQRDVFVGDNLNRKDDALRLSGRFMPADNVEVLVSGSYNKYENNLPKPHNFGLAELVGTPGGGEPVADEISSDSLSFEEAEASGLNLRINWDINDSVTLTSITDWRDWDYFYSVDVDGIGAFFPIDFGVEEGLPPGAIVVNGPARFDQTPQFGDNISQEFRLSGGNDRIDWFVGASWFQEDVNQESRLAWPIELDLDILLGPGSGGVVTVNGEDNPSAYIISGDYTSTGLYGDLSWRLTDRFTLTGGIRWTEDDKKFCSENIDPTLVGFAFLGPDTGGESICGGQSWSETTPRLVADFAVTDNTMIYASYSRGYKGGGFNTAVAGTGPAGDQPPFSLVPFDPETSDAYEIGFKATLADGQVQFNGAYYHTDYKDLQLLVLDLGVSIVNLPGVDIDGGELDFTWSPAAIDGLQLNAYYAYTDAVISAPGSSIDGSVTPDTPKNTWGINGQFVHNVGSAGTLDWFLGYNWKDDHIFDITGARYEQASYGLLDAGVRYTHSSGRWDAFLRGQNLTDEKFTIYGFDSLGLGATLNRGLPLMYMAGFNVYLGDVN